MKNPLSKRYLRELRAEWGKYLALFLFFTIIIGFCSGFLVADGSCKSAYDNSFEKYNGSREIQVAFTKECTAQKYKKESGDYLTVTYVYPKGENSSADNFEKYTFGTCAYNPQDSDISLVCHITGYYFSYTEPGNYISKLGTTLDLDTSMSRDEQMKYYITNK